MRINMIEMYNVKFFVKPIIPFTLFIIKMIKWYIYFSYSTIEMQSAFFASFIIWPQYDESPVIIA